MIALRRLNFLTLTSAQELLLQATPRHTACLSRKSLAAVRPVIPRHVSLRLHTSRRPRRGVHRELSERLRTIHFNGALGRAGRRLHDHLREDRLQRLRQVPHEAFLRWKGAPRDRRDLVSATAEVRPDQPELWFRAFLRVGRGSRFDAALILRQFRL